MTSKQTPLPHRHHFRHPENPIYDLKDYRLEMRINLQTLRRLDKDTYTAEENDEADKIAEERRKERLAAEAY
ncbi:hypothetical protein PHET_03502 [Paragonimus heterotremus]|uniref:Uncharacterized protein n=1 Tax=Paragonimus heterotremus TaxID=100268 RepID=A0A8J4X128_9TREM|nr:hypothetical protein PHET_03502 [Paragonimus heterotremus]